MNKRLLKYIRLTLLIIPITVLISCDAMLHMTYTVENKTESDIKVFVPNFPTDSVLSIYGERQDTILTIKPCEKRIVGVDSKIDFSWGTKNIYKNQPGICGIRRVNNDTIIDLGCTKAEWKYKRGNSKMEIKTNR